MKSLARIIALVLLFGVLSFAYLSPGGEALLENRQDLVLSDGTDPVAAPHQFGLVLQTFQKSPWLLLYGATPTWGYGAPEGAAIWNSWLERWFVVTVSPFVVLEQISTAWVFFLMVVSGLSMLALGRVWGWPWAVSLGVSFAWVFSAYVRARAKVHSGFVGIYHLPLIFLALLILAKGRGRASILVAAAFLFFASTVSHYYLIMVAFCAPFFLFFYFWMAKGSGTWRRALCRLILAALPVVIFNLYCVLNPIPASLQLAEAFPDTGRSNEQYHPYLDIFAARPFDFITGDTGIAVRDFLAPREFLNQWNFETFPSGNAHERTNGIRWVVWGIVIAGLFLWFRKNRGLVKGDSDLRQERGLLILFGLFALFAFWLSLPPEYFRGWGSPAYWLHSLIPQFRVSSRAGLFVQFSLLILSGLLLSRWGRDGGRVPASAKRQALLWLFPILIIAEFPPLWNPMPMAQIAPPFQSLQGLTREECGQGLSFPYVSNHLAIQEFYNLLQNLRGSNCALLNAPTGTAQDQSLIQAFGLTPQLVERISKNDPQLRSELLSTLRQSHINFIVFDPRLPASWSSDICREIKGQWHHEGTCRKLLSANGSSGGDPSL